MYVLLILLLFGLCVTLIASEQTIQTRQRASILRPMTILGSITGINSGNNNVVAHVAGNGCRNIIAETTIKNGGTFSVTLPATNTCGQGVVLFALNNKPVGLTAQQGNAMTPCLQFQQGSIASVILSAAIAPNTSCSQKAMVISGTLQGGVQYSSRVITVAVYGTLCPRASASVASLSNNFSLSVPSSCQQQGGGMLSFYVNGKPIGYHIQTNTNFVDPGASVCLFLNPGSSARVILNTAIALSCASPPTPTSSPLPPLSPPCGNYGDVNGDGKITQSDAQEILRMVAGLVSSSGVPYTQAAKTNADIDGDGRVTATDALFLMRYLQSMPLPAQYHPSDQNLITLPVCLTLMNRPTPQAPSGYTRLTGEIIGNVASGAAIKLPQQAGDNEENLGLTITLNRTNEAGFEAYLQEIYDPSSPLYLQFLTPQQQANQFGPSESEYQTVLQYMQTQGFTLTQGSDPGNRLTQTFSGTRKQAEQAFFININDYKIQNFSQPTGWQYFYANEQNPAVPNASASYIQAITGLANEAIPHVVP